MSPVSHTFVPLSMGHFMALPAIGSSRGVYSASHSSGAGTDSQPAACCLSSLCGRTLLLPLRDSRNLMNGPKLTRYLVIRTSWPESSSSLAPNRPSRAAICRFGCKHDEIRQGVFQLFFKPPFFSQAPDTVVLCRLCVCTDARKRSRPGKSAGVDSLISRTLAPSRNAHFINPVRCDDSRINLGRLAFTHRTRLFHFRHFGEHRQAWMRG